MLNAVALAIRLVTAAFCGGIIGYQREVKDRPAGFRTHILVSLGSALFMIVSILKYAAPTDPSRIAAQVVVGIGFLGAGTIIRQGNIVIGLTTAASLWATAAVGLAAGAGYYSAALGGTAMIFIVLSAFKILEFRIATEKTNYFLTLESEPEIEHLMTIRKCLSDANVEVRGEEIARQTDDRLRISFDIALPEADDPSRLTHRLLELEQISRVHLQRTPEISSLF
jgi:putative Mg2+ transporter-C (MgtC) family protein